MKKNYSKIDHVELLKAYNISLSYCTVHIVRWNIMWNVYFFLMESRTLTVSDFSSRVPPQQNSVWLCEVAVSCACIYKGCYQRTYMLILDEQS